MPLALRAFLFWIFLFALAAMNGALRKYVLRPRLGPAALPASGMAQATLLAIAIYVFVRWNTPLTQAQAWLIGAGWLILTLAAETALTVKAGRPAADVLTQLSWRSIADGNWRWPMSS